MELDKATIDEIRLMASQAKTISQIACELDLEWRQVHRHVTSWLGTKRQITNLLQKLSEENDPTKRAELVDEVDKRITYLYEQGKEVGKQIESIRRVLNV